MEVTFSQQLKDEIDNKFRVLEKKICKLELQNYLLQLFIRDIYENTEVVEDTDGGGDDNNNNSPFDNFDNLSMDDTKQ